MTPRRFWTGSPGVGPHLPDTDTNTSESLRLRRIAALVQGPNRRNLVPVCTRHTANAILRRLMLHLLALVAFRDCYEIAGTLPGNEQSEHF